MSNNHKPELCFSGCKPSRAAAIHAPLEATADHKPHEFNELCIALDDEADTATIYLMEVNVVTKMLPITRMSVSIPISMLADLVRQRPAKRSKR